MIRIRHGKLIGLLLALMLLAGCDGSNTLTWNAILQPPAPAEETAAEEADTDVLRLTMPKETGEWNPIKNASPAMQGLMQLSFEPMVMLDDAMKPTPCLAEGWSVNGNTLTLTLRRGIYFHDGSALTARDVTRTLDEILLTGEEGPYYSSLRGLESWIPTDERVVTITTTGLGYSSLYQMTFPILRIAAGESVSGTGPYALVEYIPDAALRLEPQAHWWKPAPLIPSITAISVQDHEQELTGRALDEYDLIRTRSMTASLYRVAGVTEAQDYRTQEYDLLAFNFDRPVMAQAIVRSAIAATIDRADIIASVYQNHAVACETPIAPDHWLYSPQGDDRPAEAKQTFRQLELAGFADYDNDGLFDDPPAALRPAYQTMREAEIEAEAREIEPLQGEETILGEDGLPLPISPEAPDYMTLTLLTNYDRESPVRRDAALRIARQLSAIGFAVEVEEVALSALPAAIEEGMYDMLLIGYQMPASGEMEFLLDSQAIGEQAGVHITRYEDTTMDDLLVNAKQAANDAAYKEAVAAIQKRIASELPFVGLYFRSGTLLYNANLVMSKAQRDNERFRGIESWQFIR